LEWRQLVNVNVNVNTLIDHSGLAQWFASHQCVICGLSLLLVLYSAPRGFSPGTPVFPSPQKPTFLNSNGTPSEPPYGPLPYGSDALPVLNVKFTFAFAFLLLQWGFSGPR